MSGFVGIFDLNGGAVEASLLARMAAPIHYRGSESRDWIVPGFAIRVLWHAYDKHGRLADRDGIFLAFDGSLHATAETNEPARTALDAQAQDGESFPQSLVGDFALALFDARQLSLTLARDVMGGRTLYYTRIANQILFASEIKALLAHPGVQAKPNDSLLAEFLFRNVDWRNHGATFFEGIYTVPAAHTVTVTASGTNPRRYWDFVTNNIREVTFDQAVAEYRDKFLAAVRRRVSSNSPVAVTVSGGLDSSSIFCAAMHLRERGEKLPPIHGVAFVSDHAPADERKFISDVETQYGAKIEQFPLKYEGLLTESADQVYVMEAPLLQWNAFHRIHQFARERGARTLLSGFWGDQLLQSPLYVVDEVLALRWVSAWKGFAEYRKWWGEAYPLRDSAIDFVQEAKGFLIPEALRPLYQRFKRSLSSTSPSLPFYSDGFQQRVRAFEQDALPARMRPASAYQKGILHQVYSRKHATLLEMDIKLSASYGVDLSHPFRDRDLIQFMLSIPGSVAYAGGESRAIHREAMKGILPDSIRTRLSKGDYTRPVNWAMRADAERFRRLESSKGISAGYLAPLPELKKALKKAQEDLELDSSIAVWALADVLALEEWLKTFFDAKMRATNPSEA